MVRLAVKLNLRPASCCRVLVMKGAGDGILLEAETF